MSESELLCPSASTTLNDSDGDIQSPATVVAAALVEALANPDREQRQAAIDRAASLADPQGLLVCLADHGNSRRRNAAMNALVRGGQRSVPILVRALEHEDEEVVMFAASLLGKTRDPAVVPHLLDLLRHSKLNVVMAAVDSLGELRARTAAPRIADLLCRETWLRFAAVHALGEIGDESAVDVLLPLLDDPTVREMVVVALGKIGSLRALPALARVLRDSTDMSLFSRCLCGLSALLENAPERRDLEHVAEWRALASVECAVVHKRIAALLTGDGPDEGERDLVKRSAVAVICALSLESLYPDLLRAAGDPSLLDTLHFCTLSIGSALAPALVSALTDREAGVRCLACRCAGMLGLKECLPQLRALLDDSVATVRAAAVQAIADLKGIDAIPQMVNVLRGDQVRMVRDVARLALGRMDPVLVMDALLALSPASVEETGEILEIIAANPHPRALRFVGGCLDHPDAQIRWRAVRALGGMPGLDLGALLELRLSDSAPEVRREAIRALVPPRRALLQQRLLAIVAGDREVREDAIRCLASLKDPAIAARIVDILAADASSCELGVVRAVVELGQPACDPFLVRLLGSPHASVRCIAATALGRGGALPAVSYVVTAAHDRDPEVRRAAVEALVRSRNIEALARLAMDGSPEVATEARRALEDIEGAALRDREQKGLPQ